MESEKYRKRLARMNLWAAIALFIITISFFIVHVILIKWSYIPRLLSPMYEINAPELVTRINSGFDKIFLKLCFTGFGFMVICLILIYTIWNVKKFLQALELEKE
jgi:cytochrome bd-type quinol oxidase subunit 2